MFTVYGTSNEAMHTRARYLVLKNADDSWTLLFQQRVGSGEDTGMVCNHGELLTDQRRLSCTVPKENDDKLFRETLEIAHWNWDFCNSGERRIPRAAADVFRRRAACYQVTWECRNSVDDPWGECADGYEPRVLNPPPPGSGRGGSRRGS